MDIICAISVHPDGHMLALADVSGNVTILQIVNNEEVATLNTKLGKISNIMFSENGYHMLAYGAGKNIEIWDLRNSEEVSKEISMTSNITGAVFDNSGRYLVVADENLYFFDTKKFANFGSIK